MDSNLKIYNDNAELYAAKFDRVGPRSKEIDEAFKLAKRNPRVLELGCANGKDIGKIILHAESYIGIDGAEKLLKIAKEKFAKLDFILADFRDVNFPDNQFDLVLDFASLFHLNRSDLQKILVKIHNWLSPKGIFVMQGKYGKKYQKIILEDQYSKIQYLYNLEIIHEMTLELFDVEVDKIENFYNKDWFTIYLRKKNG